MTQRSSCQDVFDYIADNGLAGALEGAHVAPLMRIDEQRATALLVDRVAQVPPRFVVPALLVRVNLLAAISCVTMHKQGQHLITVMCFGGPADV